jgi:branched-chain amino acid transport system permease protein
LIVVGLSLFFERTILGKAMRACAIDRSAAALVGISAETMSLYSFGLSALLGAVAGIVVSPITMAKYDMGTMLGLKGFCTAVLGGLGSGGGAVIGGLVLGLLEALSAGLLPGTSSRYRDAVAFLVLLLALFVRQSRMLKAHDDVEMMEMVEAE